MTHCPPRAPTRSRRRFLASVGATAAVGLAGCSGLISESPEPVRTSRFRTPEPIVFPSRLSVADGGQFLTVTQITDSEGTPRFRESYIDEQAEGYRWILDIDFDRHAAVVIETVLPEYQELAGRQVTHGDDTLSYSFRIRPSGTWSNAVTVTHVVDVWNRPFLSSVNAFEVSLRYRSGE